MTENEAIKELSYDNTAYGGKCTEEVRRVVIQALEEIQAYRENGTVEEFKALQHFESNYEHNLNAERNKAIDEFANWLYERHKMDLTEYIEWYNEEIEEQLKGGAE